MKTNLLIGFFIIITGTRTTAQSENIKLKLFKIKFDKYENNDQIDSMLYLLTTTFYMKELSKIEKQNYYYYRGKYYSKINKLEIAVEEYKKSLNEKHQDVNSISLFYDCLYSLADASFSCKMWNESYKYAFLAIKHFNPNEDPFKCIILHSIIGGSYADRKEYDKAINEYQKGIDIAKKYDECLAIELYIKQAKRYSEKKEFDKVEVLITRVLRLIGRCDNNKFNELNILKSIYYIYIQNGNYRKAITLNEEINNLEWEKYQKIRNHKLDSLELQYETELKDKKNKELIASNYLKSKVLRIQKKILWIMVICFVFLLVFIHIIFTLYKKLKKKNKRLETVKEIIALKNNELQGFYLLNQKIFTVISHDFRGPIITLKLLLNKKDTLKGGDKKFSSYINDVTNQLDYCDNMLKGLLDWAKAEMNFNDTSSASINIKKETEIFITELLENANKKNIKIVNHISENVFVNFNVFILRIVVRNIILNAIKFSYTNGIIDVYFKDNCIVIKDYGVGISQEKLNLLFKDKVSSNLGTQYEYGFGIGLHLCYKLMRENKGTIIAENNAIRGANFKIVLVIH